MKALTYAVIAALALGLGFVLGGMRHNHGHGTDDSSPMPAPAFSLIDLNGEAHTPERYRGQLLLINFWATWCTPCVLEMPRLDAAYQQYAEQGLAILGPALDDSAAVSAFLKDNPISYPVTVGDQALFSLMDEFGDTLGALPFSVLIDRQGLIVERHWGELTQAQLDELLETYL